MQTVIDITQDKHKTLFSGLKKEYEKPGTPYIRGSKLIKCNTVLDQVKKAGSIPKIIHQTWKSEKLPSRWRQYFDGWSVNHPDFLHVLWTDEDNLNLVKECYPEYLDCYNWLPLMIQKTDFVRLMYLEQYGGIYADLDYECFDNLVPHLPQLVGVMLVESPLTFTEISQNSLMVSEQSHPYVRQVLELIAEICGELRDHRSTKYPFSKVFDNPFFGKLLHTLSTLFMTGPSTLDKTFMRYSMAHSNSYPSFTDADVKATATAPSDIQLLPHAEFYEGTVAKHHHNGSWFDGQKLLLLFFVVVGITLVLLVLVCVLTTHYSTRAVYKKRLALKMQ